ncbi:hypothetical protein CPC08DRAFT_293028 [Agrocybe pediades]|nr:hypothetical protein CPC08DRAFT_293028 [Agrocybe pediades]
MAILSLCLLLYVLFPVIQSSSCTKEQQPVRGKAWAASLVEVDPGWQWLSESVAAVVIYRM